MNVPPGLGPSSDSELTVSTAPTASTAPDAGVRVPDLATQLDALKALSDPVRLDFLVRIAAAHEIACTELVQQANVTASTVSYHVKALKSAGLVNVRKEGRNYHYSLRRETVRLLALSLQRLAG